LIGAGLIGAARLLLIGGGLIGAARLLLTGRDTDDDLIDAIRGLLLTRGSLLRVARHLLVMGSGDPGGDLVDAMHDLLMIRGDSVDALSHRVERRCVELLGSGSRSGRRGQRDDIGRVTAPRNECGLRRQPAKLRVRVCDHPSGCVAVRLPKQADSCTRAKRDQGASVRA